MGDAMKILKILPLFLGLLLSQTIHAAMCPDPQQQGAPCLGATNTCYQGTWECMTMDNLPGGPTDWVCTKLQLIPGCNPLSANGDDPSDQNTQYKLKGSGTVTDYLEPDVQEDSPLDHCSQQLVEKLFILSDQDGDNHLATRPAFWNLPSEIQDEIMDCCKFLFEPPLDTAEPQGKGGEFHYCGDTCPQAYNPNQEPCVDHTPPHPAEEPDIAGEEETIPDSEECDDESIADPETKYFTESNMPGDPPTADNPAIATNPVIIDQEFKEETDLTDECTNQAMGELGIWYNENHLITADLKAQFDTKVQECLNTARFAGGCSFTPKQQQIPWATLLFFVLAFVIPVGICKAEQSTAKKRGFQ